MSRIPASANTRPAASITMTGRGLLGGGLGCSSWLTRSEVVIVPLLDGPDRHRGRVAAERRTEVGLRQPAEGAVTDQCLDPLVQRGLVGRALGEDRAVLLTGLVLAYHRKLAARRLCLGEHDRRVEE